MDDILSILREKRKRTVKEEEQAKSPVESQAVKRRYNIICFSNVNICWFVFIAFTKAWSQVD